MSITVTVAPNTGELSLSYSDTEYQSLAYETGSLSISRGNTVYFDDIYLKSEVDSGFYPLNSNPSGYLTSIEESQTLSYSGGSLSISDGNTIVLNDVVYTTGIQEIVGAKTFSNDIGFSGEAYFYENLDATNGLTVNNGLTVSGNSSFVGELEFDGTTFATADDGDRNLAVFLTPFLVDRTGSQTVSGEKTFQSATTFNETVEAENGLNVVGLLDAQSAFNVEGVSTFNDDINASTIYSDGNLVLTASGGSGYFYPLNSNPSGYIQDTNNTYVRTTGDQTIGGTKTFSSDAIFDSTVYADVVYDRLTNYGIYMLSAELLDSSAFPVLNWNDKLLKDSMNTNALSWDSRSLYDSVGSEALNWGLGYVGIGTSTPSSQLTVHADSGPQLRLEDASSADWVTLEVNSLGNLFIKTSSSDVYISQAHLTSEYGLWARALRGQMGFDGATTYMDLYTDGSIKARIDSAGRLGIGTLSPSYKLDVDGVVNTTSGYYISGSPHTHIESEITDLDKYTQGQVDTFLFSKLDVTGQAADSALLGGNPASFFYPASNPSGFITSETDSQTLSYTDGDLTISNGNTVSLSDTVKTTGDQSISGGKVFVDKLTAKTLIVETGYSAGSEEVGETYWDVDNGTLSTKLTASVAIQHGQEDLMHVKNQTGATITNGTPVWFAGTLGASGKVLVQEYIGNGSFPSEYFIGVATEDILNGGDGYVTVRGVIRGIQTNGANYGETWNDGDIIYHSATTSGYLTNVEPEAPNNFITVAAVVNAHANNGSLQVRPTWNPRLEDLQDVDGPALTTDGQLPVWNNTGQYFDFNTNINDYYLGTNPSGFITSQNVVYTTGDQTIGGTKTFSSDAIFSNVGIGTDTPATELDVVGTGTFKTLAIYDAAVPEDYLYFESGLNYLMFEKGGQEFQLSNFLRLPDDKGFIVGDGWDGTLSSDGIDVWLQGNNINDLKLANFTNYSFEDGDAYFEGNVGIGTSTLNNKLSVVGNAAIGSTFATGTAPTDGLLVEGNVGIGTTTPNAALEVKGAFQSFGSISAHLVVNSNSNGYPTIVFADNDSAVWAMRSQNASDNDFAIFGKDSLNSWNQYLTIDRQDGNVGIGTDSPDRALRIEGVSDGGLVKLLKLHNAANTAGSSVGIAMGSSSTTVGYEPVVLKADRVGSPLGQSTNFSISVDAGITYPFLIDPAGNVGIGTDTPTYKLDVVFPDDTYTGGVTFRNSDGAVKIRNTTSTAGAFGPVVEGFPKVASQQFTLNGVIQSTEDTGTVPALNFKAQLHNNTAVATRPVFGWSNYGTRLMTMLADGNVGIGTSTPAAKLDILGDNAATVAQLITLASGQTADAFQVKSNAGTELVTIDGTDGSMSVGGGALTKTGGGGTLQINSTNPYATLKLKSTTADWGFFTASDGSFLFRNTVGGFTDPFVIETGVPTNAIRVKTITGNVGIGTSSPAAKLDVNGSIHANGSDVQTQVKGISTVTGSSYSLVANDAGQHLRFTYSGDVTVTVDDGIFGQKDIVTLKNATSGNLLTVAEGTNVTIDSPGFDIPDKSVGQVLCYDDTSGDSKFDLIGGEV